MQEPKEEMGKPQRWFGQEGKWAGPQGWQRRWRKGRDGGLSREPRAGAAEGLEEVKADEEPSSSPLGSGGGVGGGA